LGNRRVCDAKIFEAFMSEHGSTGNTNASKEVTKSSVLTMRCTPSEKAKWVNAAKGQKLAEWVTEALNDAAKKEE